MNNGHTSMFTVPHDRNDEVREALSVVFAALKEKGYNPISQIVGYIMSGDPSYITSHNGARNIIVKIERDEILEVVFGEFFK